MEVIIEYVCVFVCVCMHAHIHVHAQLCPMLCNPMACSPPVSSPLFMVFSRQEYWSGVPFPTLGDLPKPGIEPASLASPALAGGFFTASSTWEAI